MNRGIRIRHDLLGQMVEHAQREPRGECCGLLAGCEGVITHVSPAENVASDPERSYEISPAEIVRLMREFRTQGLEFLGIYHSHPTGENWPSPRDIELAYYSEAVYVILSPRRDAQKPIRAFSIREGSVTEIELETLA
ncbi:MAG TPA: M67 family metallopeptidase [Candidatus Acidoferrales bacterium]|nr:M67 family metallopeptidase [Candidatus Acidoferrales bacterium]